VEIAGFEAIEVVVSVAVEVVVSVELQDSFQDS
jgi:hypothetical protein